VFVIKNGSYIKAGHDGDTKSTITSILNVDKEEIE